MKKRVFKSIAASAMAASMLFSMAAPMTALAQNENNLTIVIHNNEGLPKMRSNQFRIYQIFKGEANREGGAEASREKDKVSSDTWNPQEWDNWSLSNIEWGESVPGGGFFTTYWKFASQEAEPWLYVDGVNIFQDAHTAADVAKSLEGQSNEVVQGFANWLWDGDHVSKDAILTQGVLNEGSPDDPSDDTLTYDLTDYGPGYYMLVEVGVNGDGTTYDAVSEHILAVLGYQEIDIKASVPTVDKTVYTGENGTKGEVAGIGDEVQFELKGTLAKEFADFSAYRYVFHDTLSEGLKYKDQSAVATVKHENRVYTLADSEFTVDSQDKLDFIFEDLKGDVNYSKVDEEETPATVQLGPEDEIHVVYTAIVTEQAKTGTTEGNLNGAKIEYSNNPNGDGTGLTEEVSVPVYSLGLDLKKVGDDADHESGLPNAGFVLSKTDGGKTYYAKFTDAAEGLSSKEDGSKYPGRTLKEWVASDAEGGMDTLLATLKSTREALEKASNEEKAAAQTDYDNAKTALADYLLTSGEDGKIPDVLGLDEGSYQLTEVITPDGYVTMDPVDVSIAAELDETSGKVTKLTYTTSAKGKDGAENEHNNKSYTAESTDKEKNAFDNGLMPDQFINEKAPILPHTGGIGAMIVYLVSGMAVLCGACVVIAAGRKKNR